MWKMGETYLTFTFPKGRSLIGPPESSLDTVVFSCSFLKVMRGVEPAGDGIGSSLLPPLEAPDLSNITFPE